MKTNKDRKGKDALSADHSSSKESVKNKFNKTEFNEISQPKLKKTPKWFYIIVVLLPFLFLFILEISLNLFNYGYNTSQWVDAGSGKYVINPDIAKKYFTNVSYLPQTSEDFFDQQKKANSFRIFVLGGSSAAGYPYMPLGSFSRYIRRRLELVYPSTTIEVINISMTAVNTYTVLDLISGVFDQKPDLILLYAGHNEYYGALGVGSIESLGSSSIFIKSVLYLNKFKTTQLIRNVINKSLSVFSTENRNDNSGTLMSRMAKDKYITLNSEKFNEGIEQFSSNLSEILVESKKRNVPVIVGKLVSNLKDQKPFISTDTEGYESAEVIYSAAQNECKNQNFQKSDSLFKLAKDLDALRFRAPEKFNTIINTLCEEFMVPIVPIDSVFNSVSDGGIVGDNLMVDHLHPNLKGYQLMGKSFYEVMDKSNNLPKNEKPQIPFTMQDSVTISNYVFTDLDLTIGNNIISILKNDWPFKKENELRDKEFNNYPKNFIDSMTVKYIDNKISWADAHVEAASNYLRKDDIKNYLKYMNVLIYQYPILKDIHTAVKYLYEHKKINPTDYTIKRLGIIALLNNEYENAIKYLTESYSANVNDSEILYNLALAYSRNNNIELARNTILKCLKLDPGYAKAKLLLAQLANKTN